MPIGMRVIHRSTTTTNTTTANHSTNGWSKCCYNKDEVCLCLCVSQLLLASTEQNPIGVTWVFLSSIFPVKNKEKKKLAFPHTNTQIHSNTHTYSPHSTTSMCLCPTHYLSHRLEYITISSLKRILSQFWNISFVQTTLRVCVSMCVCFCKKKRVSDITKI